MSGLFSPKAETLQVKEVEDWLKDEPPQQCSRPSGPKVDASPLDGLLSNKPKDEDSDSLGNDDDWMFKTFKKGKDEEEDEGEGDLSDEFMNDEKGD